MFFGSSCVLGREVWRSPPNALGVVAFVRVACLVVFFRFFPCSYGKRCGGERSFLENKKAAPAPPDALGAVAFVRVAFLVLFFRQGCLECTHFRGPFCIFPR